MSNLFFERDQILDLLRELGDDLDKQGVRGELFIVGGAAMALAYNTRRSTRNIDGIFEPKTQVYETAERVGARHGLPSGWLNDAVKGLLPGDDPNARAVLSAPGIRVSVPSPQYLLALKVVAARVDRDADDIRYLADLCGARTAADVWAITEQVMGGRQRLLPKAQFLIEEMFPAVVVSPPPLNEQLRAARVAAGLSIAEVARRSKTSRAAIHTYENGTVSPSLATAQRVLAAMGCTLTVAQPPAKDVD